MKNLFLALISLCFSFQVFGATKLHLALNWKPEPQFGGFYTANLDKQFEKRNLEVEILTGGAGIPTIQMVASGKVEFGIVSGDELVIARARGADLVALYAVYQTNPQGLMVHESSGVNSLKDLFGSPRTITMQRGLGYSMFLEKKFGFSKVKIVPYGGGVGPFLADKKLAQQCFVTSEPLAAEREGAKVKTFLIADSGYNPYTTVVVAKREFVLKNEQVTKDFLTSIRNGWRVYLDNPMKTNEMMQKLNPTMDADTFKKSAEVQKPLIENSETKRLGLGAMSEKRWGELAQQLKELKIIKTTDSPEKYYLY